MAFLMQPGVGHTEGLGDSLVLDSWRHRFVGANSVVDEFSAPLSTRGLVNGSSYNPGVQYASPASNATIGKLSQGLAHGKSGLVSGDIDDRRLAALKAIWRRLDHHRQGWVTSDDMVKELQRVSDLNASDQRRLIQDLSDGSSRRIYYGGFVDYYSRMPSAAMRGNAFDDMLRSQWGFSEISEILEDMKHKFVAIGVAFAFRQALEQSKASPDGMTFSTTGVQLGEFERCLNSVNINYRPQDVKRVFDAFFHSGHSSGDKIRLASVVESLTEAPRPRTPLRRPSSPSPQPTSHANTQHPSMASTFHANTQHPSMATTQSTIGYSGGVHHYSSPGTNISSSLPPSPSIPPPDHSVPQSSTTPSTLLAAPSGRKRALTIGINYIGHRQGVLSGCINDSDTFIKILTDQMGFQRSDIRQLRDDHHSFMPTKSNIVDNLKWLIEGAKDGDHLFLHYSGHGSQQRDNDGDELDGRDETLVPCDYLHSGMLSDDELRSVLVLPLSKGVRMTCVLDCCHSGTVLDLPYKIILDDDGSAEVKRKSSSKIRGSCDADVVMISGCKDSQTSADIGAGMAGNTKSAGAMTTSFKMALQKNMASSYHSLVREMRHFLKQNGFGQVPQLMSEQFLNLTDCFLPEAEQAEESPPVSLRPPCRRAVTIGINYLSLPRGRGQLAGCINDSDTIIGLLRDTFGYEDTQIHRLRDDQADKMPTKRNILSAFSWLTGGAQAGDELFLHYSGHGGQMEDRRGDERDGKDETLLPCDFNIAGQITDDELYQLLVSSLPKGCKLLVVLDCCHSGSALDLRFKVQISPDGRSAKLTKKHGLSGRKGRPTGTPTKADVIMLSGCKDSQTSADVQAGTMGTEGAAGAMTTALRHELTPSINCHKLLKNMRQFLKRNNFVQIPQMSSEQFVQLNSSFVNYKATRKAQRESEPVRGLGPPV